MKHRKPPMFTLKSTVERREGKEARLQSIEARLEQLSLKESTQEIDNTQFLKVEERVASFEENYRNSNEVLVKRIADLSGCVSSLEHLTLKDDTKRIEELEGQVKELTKMVQGLETRLNELSRRSYVGNPVTPIGFTFGSGIARTSAKVTRTSSVESAEKADKPE